MLSLGVAIVTIVPSLGTLSALWLWPGPVGGAIYAACKALLYGIPLIVLYRCIGFRDALRWPFRPLTPSAIIVGVLTGSVIGVTIIALWRFVLAEHTDVGPVLEVMTLNGMASPAKFLAFAAWLCIVNSLLEELVFRWYVDSRLHRLSFSLPTSVLTSAAIFTIHHVLVLAAFFAWPLVVIGSAGVFIGGCVWSILQHRWGGVAPGWISHALVDVALMVVGWMILQGTQG